MFGTKECARTLTRVTVMPSSGLVEWKTSSNEVLLVEKDDCKRTQITYQPEFLGNSQRGHLSFVKA